ncbi:phage antirepressor [Nocardia africana]|uniref:phage antirepressor n=1 Tax=Nocardia africana TaxID=134964 RepID=UPI001D141651|nr:phage antirepressor KilAC domain-containing protein [Nocardia africana]MCC3311480.1 phage antirepressor KilAC domain-containing protein [Nocardia africana]
MSNDTGQLMPFNYADNQVRVVMIDGEPWFVLADLCAALDIANPRNVNARLADDQKGVRRMDTPGGAQLTAMVNESGMYEVVIRSDKPEAVAFRRWITGTVLPEIRRTGSFQGAAAPRALPSTRELAQMVIDAEDAREAAEKQLGLEVKARQAMESYVKDLEPRAEGYDRFIDGDGTYAVGVVAKMLGTGQNKLFAELRNAKIFIAKGALRNTPYQQYMHHFDVKAFEYTREDGTHGVSYKTRIQPSGVEFIARKLGRPIQQEVAA